MARPQSNPTRTVPAGEEDCAHDSVRTTGRLDLVGSVLKPWSEIEGAEVDHGGPRGKRIVEGILRVALALDLDEHWLSRLRVVRVVCCGLVRRAPTGSSRPTGRYGKIGGGQGIGARLVRAAVEGLRAEAASVLVVAATAADIGNLRFDQRQGFRMRDRAGCLQPGHRLRPRESGSTASSCATGLAGPPTRTPLVAEPSVTPSPAHIGRTV
jgi:hypothetical protein